LLGLLSALGILGRGNIFVRKSQINTPELDKAAVIGTGAISDRLDLRTLKTPYSRVSTHRNILISMETK
jgi:hypothetical protein